MNKGLFTFIVLFLTTVTIGVMFWSTSSRIEFYKNLSNTQLEKNNIKEEFDTSEIISNIEASILDKNNDLEENNKNNLVGKENENTIDEGIDNQIKENDYSLEKAKDNIEEGYKSENEYSLDDEEESIEVFKVDKHSIPSKIKRSDKLKLLSISKSLSFSDYGILLEHIKRSDELGAAVDIFKILKDRLDEDEYSVIKDVMEPYINIELIENNI